MSSTLPSVVTSATAKEAEATTLGVRWLGKVAYADALGLQTGLFENGKPNSWLLLLEHPHVFTMGVRAKSEHIVVPVDQLGAEVVPVNRGGDVTYHGPGQLIGYPILELPGRAGITDTVAYVNRVEQLIIDVLGDLGLRGATRLKGQPGVWLDPDGTNARKIAAVGVRLSRGRSMHGFSLNVDPDMAWFDKIVPCGITDKSVTSLKQEGVEATMREVVDAVVARAASLLEDGVDIERHDVNWRVVNSDLSAFTRGEGPGEAIKPGQPAASSNGVPQKPVGTPVRLMGRLAAAGVDSTNAVLLESRKPSWMRVKANYGAEYTRLKSTVKDLGLVTVCEEAGCPNIFDCWNDGTATFMINGERCTRACGFCLVDTQKPLPLDADEPRRVAEAIERMALQHAVITCVARDDLADGGAGAFAETINAVHQRCPGTNVEVLISDVKGDDASLKTIFAARPEVLNHNIETVQRLQRAVRPSASYARSLSVLARAKQFGLVTKSGLIVGLGERKDEVVATLCDLRGIGVDIVTIGQYLRPTSNHMPIDRWWTPEEFEELRVIGMEMGFAHVESSPLTRSSYHAKQATNAAAKTVAFT